MSEPRIDPNFPYGLDRPGLARRLAGFGMLAGVVTLVAAVALDIASSEGLVVVALLLVCVGSLILSALMFRTSRSTKIQASDRLLLGLDLQGDETALDLGCGNGLLAAGLSVALPRGRVIGVDAWVVKQLQPTGKDVAKATLRSAGVKGVQLRTGSIRELPVSDGSVDVAVSRDVLALLPDRAARQEAVAELHRVLRPGGRVALLEPFVSDEVRDLLRDAGFEDVARSRRWWRLFPVPRLVTGRRG
ncbi:MAG: class I SAM-dependent methyltransferase [Solirubrobacteraceae bacterium]|nr:class I SAM-dependent methyltransferase [Solirubrobacteraceae bacterium]